jgi:hypothetical protein
MINHFRYFVVLIVLAVFISACNKTVNTPSSGNGGSNGSGGSTVIGGATSDYMDTTSVTIGSVVITYSKTSQCYPSNEIFAFTATVPNLPTGATFNWTFGDGNSATGVTVGNIYNNTGTYTVVLNIKSSSGSVLYTASVSIAAWGQEVTPHATFSTQIYDVNYMNNMTFTSSSSVQHGTLTGYTWNFGDGTITNTSNLVIKHNFPDSPSNVIYPVKLIVTANSGCKDSTIVKVSAIGVYKISGDFNAVNYNICTGEYFIFTPTATGVPAGAVYSWNFADASGTSTGNPVTHTFTYQNTFNVIMTISLNGAIIYQVNKPVFAFGQNIKPKALFIKTLVSDSAYYQTWSFYSAANIPHGYFTDYFWNFGDGKTDDNFNTFVQDIYPKSSTDKNYTITFVVTGNSGCKDTATGVITIPHY